MKEIKNKERIINEMLDTYIPKEQYTSITDKHALELATLTDKHALDIATLKEQYALDIASLKEQCALDIAIVKDQHKEKLFPNSSSIKDKIKKKYVKKELKIYKNENIALKNQIEYFKNMLMMNSMYNLHHPSYNHMPPHPSHNHHPLNENKPHYDIQQPPNKLNQFSHELNQFCHELNQPHRSNVKTTEQPKNNNNENQHKNKMGNVLEQLQQLQKQKQKDV
jgi:hypothetical protein